MTRVLRIGALRIFLRSNLINIEFATGTEQQGEERGLVQEGEEEPDVINSSHHSSICLPRGKE